MNHRKAFTLIELLVVIAIIAILAAILFPVFAQAKLAAKKAASISNAKQLVLANLMYANDVDDKFSMAKWGDPDAWPWGEGNWIMNIQPYLKNYQILVSPADSDPREPGTGPIFSYPANAIACWDWHLGSWQYHGVMSSYETWILNYDTVWSTTSIGLPAETILTGERHNWTNYFTRLIRGAWDPNDLWFRGWFSDLPGQGPASGDMWGKPTSKFGSVSAVYSNNATFSFVDGHAAAMNPIKTIKGDAYNNGNCDSGFFKMWDSARTSN